MWEIAYDANSMRLELRLAQEMGLELADHAATYVG